MSRLLIFGTIAATLASAGSAFGADGACVKYEPMVVTLTGMITAHMAYGPPNYGEDPAHDAHEHYWRLDLDKPICIDGGDSEIDTPEREVRSLQIVYVNGYPKGGGWVGHRASVTGTLYHAHTGHHHTPVLITAAKTSRLEVPR